ncbi:hypothetical protein V8C35DRAFT_291439 [Trichoderma chlorosporum]
MTFERISHSPLVSRTETALKRGAFRDHARSKFSGRTERRADLPLSFQKVIAEEELRINKIRERFKTSDYHLQLL